MTSLDEILGGIDVKANDFCFDCSDPEVSGDEEQPEQPEPAPTQPEPAPVEQPVEPPVEQPVEAAPQPVEAEQEPKKHTPKEARKLISTVVDQFDANMHDILQQIRDLAAHGILDELSLDQATRLHNSYRAEAAEDINAILEATDGTLSNRFLDNIEAQFAEIREDFEDLV
jgi:formate-dependent nitrite reductase cytochrome c552 subunit